MCQTKETSLIPLPSTIIGLVCSFVWLGYGILIADPAVIVPNGLGVVFSLINLITVAIFRKKDGETEVLEKIDLKYSSMDTNVNKNETERSEI